MKRRAIQAIIRKDLKVTIQNKGVLIPLLVVPLIMFVVIPAFAGLAPMLGTGPGSPLADLQMMLEQLPAALEQTLAVYDRGNNIKSHKSCNRHKCHKSNSHIFKTHHGIKQFLR